MISRVLIANRGEIACRIIATAQRLGIDTVAVYSDADRTARHVRLADQAVFIGPAPSQSSYLNIDALLEAAKATHADAIHPGYGFLSENPGFAERCLAAGLTFIGPSSQAMSQMGDKSLAKQLMREAGVPVMPGFEDQDASIDWPRAADSVGYPLLIKAVSGGGGRGMRLVHQPDELMDGIEAAKREAKAYFDDDRLFLERYLEQPRHIEIQIFADTQGNAVYLGERDCSIQRRHQKIIEEATAPNIDADLRQAMGEAAVKAAKAIDYVGAGTVEFLLDRDGQFYFMEMNTRLQVEHPVTEMVTGLDLVEWQFLVANEAPLPLAQNAIQLQGHAIEVRVYAEDPSHEFMPSIGELVHCEFPSIEGVRIDTGYETGDRLSVHYDAMIAKIITYASDRDAAIELMQHALAHTEIVGIKTNIDFLGHIIRSTPFQKAELSTQFLDANPMPPPSSPTAETILQAAYALWETQQTQLTQTDRANEDVYSPWRVFDHWRMNVSHGYALTLWWQDQRYDVQLKDHTLFYQDHTQSLEHPPEVSSVVWQHELHLFADTHTVFHIGQSAHAEAMAAESHGMITAPMPGTVVEVFVHNGDTVNSGEKLLILEAMKMEHTLRAVCDGVIDALTVQPGDTVAEGTALLSVHAP